MKGDLLLAKKGNMCNQLFGWAIRWITMSEYEHVALFVNSREIIEAIFGTFKVIRVHNYWDCYDVYEVKATKKQKHSAHQFMKKQIGREYNIGAVAHIFWLFLTGRWGKRAEPSTAGMWFCSELVVEAYRQAGVDLCPGRTAASVTPGDIARSEKVVKL